MMINKDLECTCVDPLKPGEFMYQCGTDLCKQMKDFWFNHLSRERGTIILIDEEDLNVKHKQSE